MQPEMPLRLGAPADFARVAAFFAEHGFNDDQVCRALKLESLSRLGTLKQNEIDLSPLPPPLALLIRVFVLLQLVPKVDLEHSCDPKTLATCLTLDLLRLGTDGYYASVFLYPVAGFIVASDRHSNHDGSPFSSPPDIVFPAIFPGTLRFLRLMASSPAGTALDLCSGSGIGALVLSRSAQRAVAADITARAAHFAEFNRLLNQRDNLQVVQGDLYQAVAGQAFDRIIAHPPYVPSLGDAMIFRDGGETGEAVLRGAVEGLPEFLRPGGTFTALCMGLDTKAGRFEDRVRSWLGPAQGEFDLIFACGDAKSPQDALEDIMGRAKNIATFSPAQLLEVYQRNEVSHLVYGALFLRRNPSAKPLTARPRLSVRTDGACLEWFIGWHDRRGAIDLPSARPRLAPGLAIKSTHHVSNHSLIPSEYLLETSLPFTAITRFTDPWLAPLIARFDGSSTVAEVHAAAAGEIPASFALTDFVNLAFMLIERGYLEIPEWPLPSLHQQS